MGVTPPFLSRPARAVERAEAHRSRWKVVRLRRRDRQERQTRDGPDRRERLERENGPAAGGRGAARRSCSAPGCGAAGGAGAPAATASATAATAAARPGCGVTNVSLRQGRESPGEGLTDTDEYQILAGIGYRSVSMEAQ